MAELKTKPHDGDVDAFLEGIEDETKRADCRELVATMGEITGAPAKLWGPSMVGFGSYHYVYESGREGDWFEVGFAPRKRDLSLYVMSGFTGHEKLMAKLGKHKTGKACLYVKRLDDIDRDVLRELFERSVAYVRKTYPG